MRPWYENPTYLIVGGIAVFAAFILLRNQNSTTSTTSTTLTNNTTQQLPTVQQPLGAYQTYLDGSGVAHQIATGPYYYYGAGGGVAQGQGQFNPPPYSTYQLNASLV